MTLADWEIIVLASMPLMLEYEVVLTRRERLGRTGLQWKKPTHSGMRWRR